MALIKCKECGKEVSSKAENCPNCGVNVKRKTAGCGTPIAIILFILVMSGVWESFNEDKKPGQAEKSSDKTSDTLRLASGLCSKMIEQQAKYDYRWTDGFFTPRFNGSGIKKKDSNNLIYYGDRLEMQNGFGAWMNHIYYCEFNTLTGDIVDLDVNQGRL